MAEIVSPEELVRSVGRQKIEYPWSEWTDGQTRRVTQGKDFSCSVKSFRSVLSKYASQNGLKAVIGTPDGSDTIVFRFEPRPEGWAPRTRTRKAPVENAVVGEVGAATLPDHTPEVAAEAAGDDTEEVGAEGEESFEW